MSRHEVRSRSSVKSVRRVIGLVGLATSVALVGAGCATTLPSGTAVSKPATKPAQIIVRTWGEPFRSQIADTAAKKFTADTGIKVKFDTTDEAVIQTKVSTAIRAGQRPPVDVTFNADTRGYLSAAQSLVVPLDPKIVTNLGKLSSAAKPSDLSVKNGWPYVDALSFTVPIIYRTDKVKPEQLTSWTDLASPAFAGKIAMDGIYQSTAFTLAKAKGIDPSVDAPKSLEPVWSFLRSMKGNVAVIGGDAGPVPLLKSGQATVAIAGSYAADDAKKQGVPVAFAVPKEGVLLDGDAVWVNKNLPKDVTYYSQVFVNDLLDAQVQTKLAAVGGVMPVNLGATLPAVMKADPEVYPVTDDEIRRSAVPAPVGLMARNNDAWQAAYESALK